MPPVRRLTAILVADVAGYSRLMGADEEGTHERLTAHLREVVNPKIAEHRGRIVKNTGDGFLAEFASVVDAVRCAVEVQRQMGERNVDVPPDQRIEFRMGINLGDIIKDGRDIYGDGVNVAARLEALAEPGGICVSLAPAIADAERHRAARRPPDGHDTWSAYQRGPWHLSKATPEDNKAAQKCFGESIVLDATFSGGHSWACTGPDAGVGAVRDSPCRLEVIREDYVRTARAKGLSRRPVITFHALPNALLPVITLSGILLGFVLAGSFPVERAFGTPGLGYAMFTAVSERDVFVMQNLVFLYAVVFVLLNILVDVTIAWIDPRIRYR